MALRFRPIGTWVAVQQMKPEQVRASGIIIPQTVGQEEQVGTVIGVGDKVVRPIQKGDLVAFLRLAGTEIEIGNERLLLLAQEDLLGVFEQTTVDDLRRVSAGALA